MFSEEGQVGASIESENRQLAASDSVGGFTNGSALSQQAHT